MDALRKIWVEIFLVTSLTSILTRAESEKASETGCFDFPEKSKNFAYFNVSDLDLSDSSEFNLTFRTTKEDGMIFYIEGQHSRTAPYDFESLYIRNGKLNHLVFNPEPTGIGSSFGSHVITDFDVNTDNEMEVNFFRRKEFPAADYDVDDSVHLARAVKAAAKTVYRTGFVVNGREFTILSAPFPLDLKNDKEEQLIWIGGAIPNRNLDPFEGIIRDIFDVKSNRKLTTPDSNKNLYMTCRNVATEEGVVNEI